MYIFNNGHSCQIHLYQGFFDIASASAFRSAFNVSSTDCRTSPSRCVRISFSSILIAPEIAFSSLHFPWPVFLSFDYGLVTIINQKTGPFSSAFFQNVRNFPDVIIGFVYRKNALKRILTFDLYLRLEMNRTGWTKAHLHNSSDSPR